MPHNNLTLSDKRNKMLALLLKATVKSDFRLFSDKLRLEKAQLQLNQVWPVQRSISSGQQISLTSESQFCS